MLVITRPIGSRWRWVAPTRVSVGRSFPSDEIADLDAAVEQLRADVRAYDPPQGDQSAAVTWAAITHKLNGFVLRWGQFKTYADDVFWWSDGDDVKLSSLRNEYNLLRKEVLDYTQIRVNAPPIERPPELDPDHDPPEKPSGDLTVRELALYLLVGGIVVGAGYGALRLKLAGLLGKVAKSAGGAAA